MPRKALTLLGPISPIIKLALLAACSRELDIRHSSARGRALIQEAVSAGMDVVIAPRTEVADLCGNLPPRLLLLGVSTASWDVLACRGDAVEHINASPERIASLVRDFVQKEKPA